MTSEIPGENSQHFSAQQPHQSSNSNSGSGGYGTSTQTLPPQQTPPPKKQMNIVGLIALITGVLGFIFACIPGALIVGWILLPIAFILGIVSLFLKDKSRWMGITGLVLSVVGTIVGVIVFFTVVATSLEESFSSGDLTAVESSDEAVAEGTVPSPDAAEEGAAGDEGTRANPYALGSVIESEDWRVVVNSVTLAATDAVIAANEFNEPPAAGSEYILVNYSATYLGDDPNGMSPLLVTLEYATAEGTTINSYDNFAQVPEPMDITSALYTDGTATGNIAFEVPSASAGQGVLAVSSGFMSDKAFVAVQ